ncbi:MAG: Endoribonuclease YbeY [Thermoanaerobacterales bacterium 50_218]|nr:MAG: Endoribonuclease YbeY [Thermoanaerobacterales bacterium 50_218]HAA89202.1 rRNA maturation RNase YbeY [Peptococcaceae bacterium]
MQLLISNQQDEFQLSEEDLALIRKALEEVLRQEGFPREAEVSILFVDDTRMAELNKKYRGVEGTTDVLAFPMLEGEPGNLQIPEEEEVLLGDIVISIPKAYEQAAACGNTFTAELVFLAVHGMLHLLGHDHATPEEAARMRQAERKVLANCSLQVKEVRG